MSARSIDAASRRCDGRRGNKVENTRSSVATARSLLVSRPSAPARRADQLDVVIVERRDEDHWHVGNRFDLIDQRHGGLTGHPEFAQYDVARLPRQRRQGRFASTRGDEGRRKARQRSNEPADQERILWRIANMENGNRPPLHGPRRTPRRREGAAPRRLRWLE